MFLGVHHTFLPHERLLNLKDKFLFHCSQNLMSAGDHMQIIGDPVSAVDVKVLTSQTLTYKLCRVCYVSKSFCCGRVQEISFIGFLYISLCKGWIRCRLLIKLFFG